MEEQNKDPMTTARELRVATWNIHDAKGTDGVRSPERIARVLGQVNADVVGLQEIGCGSDDCDVAQLARQHDYYWAAVPTVGHKNARRRGNALLSKLPIRDIRIHDLSHGRHEPRAALETQLIWGQERLRVVVTHLGLHAGERRYQVDRLLGSFRLASPAITILLGDINEWWLWGRPLRWLHRHFGASPSVRTFPAWAPLFALDRIWVHPQPAQIQISALHSPELRRASDHLPVVARIRMG
jgi:endonuclease/exonuclease/phosphatase family metal-dependent hydrolase